MASQQKNTLKFSGLHTLYNSISSLPEGALLKADNIVIDRNNVIEPRRGIAKYGDDMPDGDDRAKQLMTYKGRVFRHFNDTIQFDSDGLGTFFNFNGSFTEPESGIRIKYIEANGNFYFTTSDGIKKISATSASQFTTDPNYIRDAGGVKALDVTATVDYTTAGFLSGVDAGGSDETAAVAYRVVWGIKDRNNNLILGSPSSRTVVINFSETNSGVVDLSFTIPDQILTTDVNYFYQIYRTAVVAGTSTDPGDEMNLVIEDFPTNNELTVTRIVNVTDITPEDFREGGTPLYTNPVSGDGILQSNEPPPLAKDLALFKNSVFYANTQTRHRLEIDLISVAQLISGTSTITISDGSTTTTYTFVGKKEITDITTVADIADSLNNKYFYINSSSDARQYYVWFNTGTGVDPLITGRLGIEVVITTGDADTAVAAALQAALDDFNGDFAAAVLGAVVTVTNTNNGNTTDANDAGSTGFMFSVTQQGDGEDASNNEVFLSAAATPSQQIDETARSLVNIINQNSADIISAFYLSGPNDVPGLMLFEAKVLGGDPFFVTVNNASTTGSQFNPSLPSSGQSVISDNEVQPNAIFFSKLQQPEAVPLVNFLSVGPRDKAIMRILALRESLFVLKEDGIYRITGENGNFVVDLFDNSANIIAADSASVLNNQIYILTSKDIATISDTGVSIISRPIENLITAVTKSGFSFATSAWGLGYESERAYFINLPSKLSDDVATQCLRYNLFTNTWTRWIISKTCGVVNTSDNRLYLGASDDNFIERERKDFLRTDYADRDMLSTIPDNAVNDREITLGSTQDIQIGDAIVQTQYLSIYKFNQLLKKLDRDMGVADSDYFSSLEASAGDNLRNSVDNLATKLDADTGVADSNYLASLGGGSTFSDIQDDFNIIVNKLNADTGVFFTTYKQSTGTVDQEVIVIDINRNTNTITAQFSLPFILGPIIIYHGIPVDLILAPETFGDPSMMKHVREHTTMFERNNFSRGLVAYSGDLSPDFEKIEFNGVGKGDFGLSIWDQHNWGGLGSQVPMRTYIPRDKQRARLYNFEYQSDTAREKYSIFGISWTFRGVSERAYRTSAGN